jgi:hypothetical protein
MLLAEMDQMVLFDEISSDAMSSRAMQAPPSLHPWGPALCLALILVSWLPIALLIWFLT